MRTNAPPALACWLVCVVAAAAGGAELTVPSEANAFGGKIVVGYATAGRPEVFTEPATRDFAFARVTHVVLLGGVTFDKDGVVTVNEKLVAEPVAVTHAKQRKFSAVFVGPYAAVFASPKARETLIAGVIAACKTHGFDGADFDYEYPKTMQQRADFETFLTDLRAAAPPGMLLSVAVSAWGTDRHLVPVGAASALDWVFLMGYGPAPARMTLESSAREVQNCLDWGVPPAKMVLGMPIYGCNGTDGPGYAELLGDHMPARTADEYKGWHFNGPATIERKARHAVEKGAAGVGWWYIGLDCQDDRSVMEAAVQALRETGRDAARQSPATSRRPNILFIFSDDHAEKALSCYGSRVNTTPHLDRIATAGARFTNSFVTNSICSPSRATLLTGQYSHLNGVPVFNPFDGSRDHVAKRLQAAGYHTGMVGKWHLGSDPTGFDRWIILPGQGAYWNPMFLSPEGKLTIEGHCTEILGDLGIEFLKTRPADKPFFLMLHHKAPHRAWEPDECNKARFAAAEFPDPPTLFDDYATRPAALPENAQTIARHLTNNDLKLTPPAGLSGDVLYRWKHSVPMEIAVNGRTLTGPELVRWKYRQFMRDYLACVQGVDDSVGEVLDYLDASGLAADTIVIYTTDNGWYMGELGLYDKRFMYEPGLRVPLLAKGPGIKAGITPNQLVANIDLAPTFLDLAGVPVPDSMQGRSLAPLLRGEEPTDWRTSVYYRYYHDPGDHDTRAHVGVRTATHKLIHYWTKDAWELFDLAADPLEQRNLLAGAAAARSPAVAKLFADMQAELARLRGLYRDEDQYADPATRPKERVDGVIAGRPALGVMAVPAAIALSRVAAER